MYSQEIEERIKELLKKVKNKDKIDYMGMSAEDFGDFVEMIEEEGLIQGAKMARGGSGNKALVVFTDNIRLTLKGVRYLSGRTNIEGEEEEEQEVKLDDSTVKTKNVINVVNNADSIHVNDIERVPSSKSDKKTEIDYLGYGNLARIFSKFISSKKTELPISIGIFGNWGSGKSSFVEMIKKGLEEDKSDESYEKVTSIDFNAWEYPEQEEIWFGMMQTITEDFLKNRSLTEKVLYNFKVNYGMKKLIWNIFKLIITTVLLLLVLKYDAIPTTLTKMGLDIALPETPINLIAIISVVILNKDFIRSLFSSILSPISKSFMKIIKFKDYTTEGNKKIQIEEGLSNVSRFLEKENERLVIFIDDLDRCSHDKLIKVMEATHIFLNQSRIIIVYALDNRIMRAAIQNMYRNEYEKIWGETNNKVSDFSEEYLDKFIQIPFFLKPPNEFNLNQYIDYLFPIATDNASDKSNTNNVMNPMQGEEEEELENSESEIYDKFVSDELIAFKEAIRAYNIKNPRCIKKMSNLLLLSKALFFSQKTVLSDFVDYIYWFVFNFNHSKVADILIINILVSSNLKREDSLEKLSSINRERLSVEIDGNESIFPDIYTFDILMEKVFENISVEKLIEYNNLANYFIKQSDGMFY